MTPEQVREFLEILMLRMWGTPYRWGGDDPMAGFDCSGAVHELLLSCDLIPSADMNAQGLHDHFARHTAEARAVAFGQQIEFGDLLFFGTSVRTITHVAIAYADNVMFEFGGGGSKTTTADAAIKQNAYGRFRPIARRSDLVASLRLSALSA